MPNSDGSAGGGYLHVVLTNAAGEVVSEQTVENIITTNGDEYYTRKAAVSVGSYGTNAPAPVNGMKLGTASATATKSGTGSYITTAAYLSGSNRPLDNGFPTVAAASGTDTGWEICYQATWPAGTATSPTINEVEVCTDQATNAGHSTGTAVVARAVLTTVNKAAGDSLAITWYHKYLGTTS